MIASPLSVLPTSLPGGGTVTVDQVTGVVTVTSTPASTLGITPIRVTVLDACGAAAVRIFNASVVAPPMITDGPPPSPVVIGTPYNFALTSTGFPAPTYAITAGALPPGLTVSSPGVLSGTPNTVGTGSFPNITVTASNSVAPAATQNFGLNVVTFAPNYLASFGLTGAAAALTADPDGDGLANLLEYALGMNPKSAAVTRCRCPSSGSTAASRTFDLFSRSSVATDLTYTVQASADLQTWTDLASSSGGAATTGPGFVQESGSAPVFNVEVRDVVPVDPVTGPQRFLRLRVSTP